MDKWKEKLLQNILKVIAAYEILFSVSRLKLSAFTFYEINELRIFFC